MDSICLGCEHFRFTHEYDEFNILKRLSINCTHNHFKGSVVKEGGVREVIDRGGCLDFDASQSSYIGLHFLHKEEEKMDTKGISFHVSTCAKCGKLPESSCVWELGGSYFAVMCVSCLNEWTDYLHPREEWKRYEVSRFAIIGGTVDMNEVVRYLEARSVINSLARAWVSS